MNTVSPLLLLWWLVVAAFAQASEPSGVYVNKTSADYRIEFLPSGECFFSSAFGDPLGTYMREKDTLICKREDEESLRFRVDGKVLIEQDGSQWVPRDEIAKVPWTDVSPVTIVVLDSETRKPITRFSYTYRISTPTAEYDPLLVRPVEVRSESGSFTFAAPKSCEIEMEIEGGNVLGGFGAWNSYHLTSDNRERKIEALVATGITVSGEVVDPRTDKPIAGALVSPMVFTPPSCSPDRRRAVKTDAAGKFALQGVEPNFGISVRHPEYYEFHRSFAMPDKKTGEKSLDVRVLLASGETLIGTVKDPAGKPLAGVKVSDGAGKMVRTAATGSFALGSPSKDAPDDIYSLRFEKDGYLRADLRTKLVDPKGFVVVLQPLPTLVGRVLDAAGRPVNTYQVFAGVGREPRPWKCESKQVHAPDGRFSLPVSTDLDYGREKQVWIGVKASGYAVWETTIAVWQGERSISVRLTPGSAVYGSVKAPATSAGSILAVLLPCRIQKEEYTNETSQRQELGRMEAVVDSTGDFRFQHIAPGQYVLAIAGPTISPISAGIVVADSDLNAGSFSPRGTGSVAGIIYKPEFTCEGEKCRLDEKRRPWAFAEGDIRFADSSGRSNDEEFKHLKPIRFKADEHGRFRTEGIPLGPVSVEIPYHVTADMIDAHHRNAIVFAGKTTEVRFFDVSGAFEVTCKFLIGDGSPAHFSSGSGTDATRKVENVTTKPPMFEVELRPLSETPTSFCNSGWEDLDNRRLIPLRDVHPGKYQMVVRDWQGSIGLHQVVYETSLELKGGKIVWIPLGGGCITGATQWSNQYRYMVHVIAVGKKTRTIREAYCDEKGNFCARYLPEDDYALFAHDYDAGWRKMPEVSVKNNVTDIGSHRLVPGATIAGKLPLLLATAPTVTVVATDSHGIAIERPDHWDPIGNDFCISGLWPGKWTVRLRKGDQVLAEKSVTLQGTERVPCDFDGK